MTQLSTLAVNVFEEENKTNEAAQQQNIQTPAPQPDAKTSSPSEKETTTQTLAQDNSATIQDPLSISIPWIAAGIIAAVILVALLFIIRKLNVKR